MAEMEDRDEAYYMAIAAGMDTNMLAAARDVGNSFLYQDSYARDRSAVLIGCQTHQQVLRRLLEIKQVPDLLKIERALQRSYTPIGRAYGPRPSF